MKDKKRVFEAAVHGIFLILGLITVGCVLLSYRVSGGRGHSRHASREIGLGEFLLGKKSAASTAAEPSYGILPFILTSIYGTAGAMLLGVPVGFLTAVYLSKAEPPKVKAVMETAVSLLAGIPSVVYGLVGMLVLVPGVRKLFGDCPTARACWRLSSCAGGDDSAVHRQACPSRRWTRVPREYEDASRLALGAAPVETCFPRVCPCPRQGAAWPRRWCWAWAAPSARPWPS